MFMQGPDNINQLPVDPSTMMGKANEVQRVSRGSAPVGSGKGPEILDRATVAGTGVNQAAIGELFAQGNITYPKNFYTVKSSNGHDVTGHPIDAQMAALLPEHPSPETTAQFEALNKLARAPEEGLPQTSRRVSSDEISLAQKAVMPQAGIISANSLRAIFNAGPVGLGTAKATSYWVDLFQTAQE